MYSVEVDEGTKVLKDCVAIVVIEDSGVSVFTIASEVARDTGVLENCVTSVAGGDSGLPEVFVLTVVSVIVDSGVAGDSILIEVSVVDENSVLL